MRVSGSVGTYTWPFCESLTPYPYPSLHRPYLMVFTLDGPNIGTAFMRGSYRKMEAREVNIPWNNQTH